MPPDVDMNTVIGTHDVLFVTLDTLRMDAAQTALASGRTPNLEMFIGGAWERRHTPGSFTYAAHQAFFAGFLPTPADPAASPQRLFAAKFAGSETTGPRTRVFEADNLVTGLAEEGYRTICIGGVGFFNKRNALSRVLPDLFHESHWDEHLGVTHRTSTQAQFTLAGERLEASPADQPVLLFINISALHQPNYFYLRENGPDDLDTHTAALAYVDFQWPLLMRALDLRSRPWFFILCSDHGTAYGEDGWTGHRLAHPVVWEVPYAHGFYHPPALS
jgi:hypothetical protein